MRIRWSPLARELVFESCRIFYDVADEVRILTVRGASESIDGIESAPPKG